MVWIDVQCQWLWRYQVTCMRFPCLWCRVAWKKLWIYVCIQEWYDGTGVDVYHEINLWQPISMVFDWLYLRKARDTLCSPMAGTFRTSKSPKNWGTRLLPIELDYSSDIHLSTIIPVYKQVVSIYRWHLEQVWVYFWGSTVVKGVLSNQDPSTENIYFLKIEL